MQIVRTVRELREWVGASRAEGRRIGFVPTMGALHAGHMSLVEAALQAYDTVVASIFVNPTQFGPGEDLDAYPRQEAADAKLLERAGVGLLFVPSAQEMYPEGFATTVSVGRLAKPLCGEDRPGHFDGVATVVTKLLNQVCPNAAFFGEKDWQQLTIIRRLTADLDLGVEIVGVPTVREEDGLALSSRNAYLSKEERQTAAKLPEILRTAAVSIAAGEQVADTLAVGWRSLEEAGFVPQYLELRDPHTLEPAETLGRPARLFVAARLGKTRLIDNVEVAAEAATPPTN